MLTLNRPQAGNVVIFDTHDYAIIDFRLITNQWIALVPIGGMLRIVFRDGAVIELLNFFSSGLADDSSNGDNHTGTTPDAFASSDWCGPPTPSFCRRLNFSDRTGLRNQAVRSSFYP